jgi:hypothetical protein
MEEERTPQQKPPDELRRLRTFQSDVEELLQKQRISKAAIAISESEKKAKAEEETAKAAPSPFVVPSKILSISSDIPASSGWNTRLIAFIAVSVLVLGGIGVGFFFLFKEIGRPKISEPEVSAPESAAIKLDERESREAAIQKIWSRVQTLSVPQNELRIIPITLDASPVTTAELFEKIEAEPPAPLVRALGSETTLGVHGFRGGKPFLLWSVSSFDHAFDGMLSWEPNLLGDVGPLFGISVREIAGGAGSTTGEVLQNTPVIKDVIIKNKDTRAVFDAERKIIFLYSFIDKETLIMTTSEDTLRFLMGRAGGGRLR